MPNIHEIMWAINENFPHNPFFYVNVPTNNFWHAPFYHWWDFTDEDMKLTVIYQNDNHV